jgi:Spy/CpxP family protein refolding chaperone
MKLNNLLALAGVAVALTLTPIAASAQGGGQGGGGGNRGGGPGGGNFDPAQWQQRMMERVKEQLEITDETEWKAVEPLITKVNEARRAQMAAGMGGMMRGGRGGQGGGGRGGMFGEPNPAAEALQKAIDSKASKDELKAAMTKVREARKAAEEKVKQAQDELKKVLTTRQEAILLANGTLS